MTTDFRRCSDCHGLWPVAAMHGRRCRVCVDDEARKRGVEIEEKCELLEADNDRLRAVIAELRKRGE